MLSQRDLAAYRYQATQDFFSRPEIIDLIKQLASKPDLTIFLGAGASIAQGLPTWHELLHRMLMSAATADGRFPDEAARQQWVDAVIQNYDATAAGSVLRTRLNAPRAFRSSLHKALYDQVENFPNGRGSDRFSASVWDLVIARHTRGWRTTICTLNYDDSLERAFAHSKEIKAAFAPLGIAGTLPVFDEDSLSKIGSNGHLVPIYHLHGYLPWEGWVEVADQRFIISASDYSTNWRADWSSQLIESTLDSHWLMTGMSFQDPHISSLLLQRKLAYPNRTPSTVGIVSTQGNPWRELPPVAAELLAEAEQARLGELDLLCVVTSYFFQDYGFLQELAFQAKSSRILPYRDRREQWQEKYGFAGGGFYTGRRNRHTDLSAFLVKLRDSIEDLYSPAGEEELLKAEVWIRDVSARGLRLGASSEMLINDAKRAPFFRLSPDSPIAAVKAFTNGAPRTFDREGNAPGSWNSFAGFPLYLDTAPWLQLPIGSLVLGSSLPLGVSTFAKKGTDVINIVQERMPDVLELLASKKGGLTAIADRLRI